MIKFVLSDNLETIWKLLNAVGENPTLAHLKAAVASQFVYTAYYNDVLVGFISFRPFNQDVYEIHVNLIHGGLGRKIIPAAIKLAKKDCKEVVAFLKPERTDLRNLALKTGFTKIGELPLTNIQVWSN